MVLLKIIQKSKKCIQPQFKNLFPYWFLQMNDGNKEVAQIAQRAFDEAFPKEKQLQAFSVCEDKYFVIAEFTIQNTAQLIMKDNSNLNEQQAQEICDRTIVSALNSLVSALDLSQNAPSVQEKVHSILFRLPGQKKNIMLELLEDKKRYRTKAAAISLLSRYLSTFKYSEELHADINKELEGIIKAVIISISDKERLVQIALWNNCLINIFRSVPFAVIKKCDLKAMEQRTLEIVKHCAYGIGTHFYSNLIIFFSLLPHASFEAEGTSANCHEEAVREKFRFISNFLENIIYGF